MWETNSTEEKMPFYLFFNQNISRLVQILMNAASIASKEWLQKSRTTVISHLDKTVQPSYTLPVQITPLAPLQLT